MSYKIEIRNSEGWRTHSAVTIGVSVTSPNCTGEKFAAVLAFAENNFKQVRIDLTDALYRHGLAAEGIEASAALMQAKSFGALWLVQNSDEIERSTIKPNLIRWADWYKHPNFEATLSGFKDAFRASAVLRSAVNLDIEDFGRRRDRVLTSSLYDGSKNFYIEELAVMTLQARELGGLRLYAGSELNCVQLVRRGGVKEAPSGLEKEQFARVRFIKRNAPEFPKNLRRSCTEAIASPKY